MEYFIRWVKYIQVIITFMIQTSVVSTAIIIQGQQFPWLCPFFYLTDKRRFVQFSSPVVIII